MKIVVVHSSNMMGIMTSLVVHSTNMMGKKRHIKLFTALIWWGKM